MIIRPTTDHEKEWLKQLHHLCYRVVVEEQFGPWDEADQDRRFYESYDEKNYQGIEIDGSLVGAFDTKESEDHIFLSEIQIHPDSQNKGIGTKVMKQIISKAKEKNKPLYLQALKKNKVRKLYERLGFETFEESDTHFKMRII